MFHVVGNANHKMIFLIFGPDVVVYRFHHGGSEFFGGKSITPSQNDWSDDGPFQILFQSFLDGIDDIEV